LAKRANQYYKEKVILEGFQLPEVREKKKKSKKSVDLYI